MDQHRLNRILDSRDADAIVRAAHRITVGWNEYLNEYSKCRRRNENKHPTEVMAIHAIKSTLSALPPETVCRALLRNLSIRRYLVATGFGNSAPHELSPLRIESNLILTIIDLFGLRMKCDKLVKEDEAIKMMLSVPSPLIYLHSLLADADGHGYATISRSRLSIHEYNGMGRWIKRIGKNLYSYGYYFTDW